MNKFFLNQVFFKDGYYLVVRGVTGKSFTGVKSNQELLLEVRSSVEGSNNLIKPSWLAHSFVLTKVTSHIAAWESQEFLIAKNFLKEGKKYVWLSADKFSREVFESLEVIVDNINRELNA